MRDKIYYSEGFKYQLKKDYNLKVDILPYKNINTEFISLDVDGILTVRSGYAWDGPSGPTYDTPSFMRGSLIHDALYQLIRMGHIDQRYKKSADKELKRICLEDNMMAFRAWYVYNGVRKFGGGSAKNGNVRKVIEAP